MFDVLPRILFRQLQTIGMAAATPNKVSDDVNISKLAEPPVMTRVVRKLQQSDIQEL